MNITWISLLLGACAAILAGFSKTGLPGAAMPAVALMGFLAGLGSTVANAGGPMMTIYLLGQGVAKEQFIGTCAWFFFLLNLAKILPFLLQGMLTPETVRCGLAMSPLTILGAVAGAWLLPRVSERVFNALVSLLAAVAAVWLIVS
jgi:uncharacterized membrane protein YfcA